MNALHVKTTLYIQIDSISVMCILRLKFFFLKKSFLSLKKIERNIKIKALSKTAGWNIINFAFDVKHYNVLCSLLSL